MSAERELAIMNQYFGRVRVLLDLMASELAAERAGVEPVAPREPQKRPIKAYSEEFERFWEEYPKKKRIGKYAAFAAWRAHTPPLERCIETLRAQKTCQQWTKDGGQFIPLPITWIRQHRWEDESAVAAESKYEGLEE